MAKNFWGSDKPGATTVDTLIGRQTEIHGDERAISAAAVDHAVHDDGPAAAVAVGIGPGDLELGDVGLVDLL
jgi:hypothetical protein